MHGYSSGGRIEAHSDGEKKRETLPYRERGGIIVKIILANPRGFCAGVNMAIESLERALELFGQPLFVYHEIVHNRPVVDRFRKRGAVFVDSMEEIPEGANVLYSAHGVAPAIREAAQRRRLR